MVEEPVKKTLKLSLKKKEGKAKSSEIEMGKILLEGEEPALLVPTEIKHVRGKTGNIQIKVLKKRTFVREGDTQSLIEKQLEEQKKKEALIAELKKNQSVTSAKKIEKGSEKSVRKQGVTSQPKEEEGLMPGSKEQEDSAKKQKATQIMTKVSGDEEGEVEEEVKKVKGKKIKEKQKRLQKKIDLRSIDLEEESFSENETEKGAQRNLLGKEVSKTLIPIERIRIKKQKFERPTQPVIREIIIPKTVSVSDLAKSLSVKGTELIKILIKMGVMATLNQNIDQETAVLVVEELGHQAKVLDESALEKELLSDLATGEQAEPRPPVVTIMGHVDHGKTSLLDYIRRSKVALGEAGGITQNIGAYHVKIDQGTITFLDTPGHEAFTAMRARGVQATDIVILVVAADDGVQPQTIEALQHAKAAGVPIIVAVNKIDKPEADVERVKTELSKYEVIPEEWGGQSIFVPVSAKTGQGVNQLLDAILLQAEMLELKAVVQAPARGVVIESRLDKKRGPVASILVQEGTLHTGDIILAGTDYGRVRILFDELGRKVDDAAPSIPVEVLGLSGTPMAGESVIVVKNERKAKEVALFRQSKRRDDRFSQKSAVSLDNIFEQLDQRKVNTLNIILKANVQGSAEALKDALTKLSTEEVRVNIVSSGVGAITESDVHLAVASSAVIIGFDVRASEKAKKMLEIQGVDVRYYSIIYEIINDVKAALSGLLSPEIKEKIIGLAEVREVFRSPKFGVVSGCMVMEGVIKRNRPIRVLRDHVVIHQGDLDSLRRFKEDASEVRQGMECGIGVKDYQDIKVGDRIEVYERYEVARTLATS